MQHVPPLMVTDLFEDIKDGVMLLALLEVLSGQKLVSLTVNYTACDIVTDRIMSDQTTLTWSDATRFRLRKHQTFITAPVIKLENASDTFQLQT